MAQRTISECDLCKGEAEDMHKITIKKPGKKAGNTYDLCTGCSQSLQSALVGSKPSTIKVAGPFPAVGGKGHENRRKELNDAELDENDLLLQNKGHSMTELEDEPPEDVFGDDGTVIPPKRPNTAAVGQCVHANRSSPKCGDINGTRTFYTRCRDCNAKIPMKTSQQRAAFTKGSTGNFDIKQGQVPKKRGK